jgi:hypothetical protein
MPARRCRSAPWERRLSIFDLWKMKKFIPPFLFLLIGALAYLPLAHLLGYYNDDWYLLYLGLSQGSARFMDVFAIDRPFRGYFVGWLFDLFGTQVMWYTYAAFLARLLSAYGLFRIIRRVWPSAKNAALLGALLFLIYPGFLDQPNALDYQSHQWSLVLAVFSILCTLKAFELGLRTASRVAWLALSIIQQLLSLLLMEYYIGLEGLRFLLIWQVTCAAQAGGRVACAQRALLRYLPNLLVALVFFIWRAFFFNSARIGTDVDVMLLNVAESPALRLLWIFVYQLKDLLNTLIFAWVEPLYSLVFTMRLKNILLALAFGAVGLAVAWLFLRSMREPPNMRKPDAQQSDRQVPQSMIWIGLLSILCALLPVHLGSRHILFASFSRFTLTPSLGAAIVLAGLWTLLPSIRLRIWLPAALVGIAVTIHTANTLGYVENWKLVRDFWWQVSWRAPNITQGTNLVASYPPGYGIAEDYFVWGPASLIYYPNLEFQSPTRLPLTAATLDKSNLQLVLAGRRQERERRSILSEADFANTLVLSMPTESSCVHVLDGRSPELSSQDRAEVYLVAPFSRLERVDVAGASPTPPQAIFGSEPARGWCYFYQKASLARQGGDWQEAARLGDEAQTQGLRPVDWVEWMPFVEAYAYTGQPEKVSQLAPILMDDLYLRYQTCRLIELDGRNEAAAYPEGHQLLIATFCD